MALNLSLFGDYEEDLKRARVAFNRRQMTEGLAILDRYKGLLAVDVDFAVLYSDFLHALQKSAEADEILARALEIQPTHERAILARAQTMAVLRRRAEALALLETAHAGNRDSNGVLTAYLTLLLGERGIDPAIAALKREHLRRTPPRRLDMPIEKLRQKALSLLDPEEIRKADPDDLLELVERSEDQGCERSDDQGTSLRRIYETFESMGCNCELGFVQSRTGAQPLSLLRWSAITPENLVRLLACDLDGYENPAHYSLRGNYEREFHLYESAFDTQSHTGVNQNDISAQEFLDRMTRRQAYLKRKFLADAAEGRKVFIYKADTPLVEAGMAAIETELLRLGVRHRLFVMPTTDPALAGTVTFATPGRGVGYLSSVQPDIQYDEWNRIAIATYDQLIRGNGAK